MNTALLIGVLLLFSLAFFGSAWYVAFRVRITFGLQRWWLLRVLVVTCGVQKFDLRRIAGASSLCSGGVVLLSVWYVVLQRVPLEFVHPTRVIGRSPQ